jgi:molybdopterin/thiamine biosynthesis adenylyltransferase
MGTDPAVAASKATLWPPPLRMRHWAPEDCLATAPGAIRLKGLPGDAGLLAKCCVAVVGTGAVGGVVLAQCARLGIGTLIAVDCDAYTNDSVLTQPALAEHITQPKAFVQGALAHAIHPRGTIHAAAGNAQELPLALLRRADVIVSAGDNLELLVWAGVMGRALNKIVIQGAVHGETATALVRTFVPGLETACPGCMLNSGEWNRLDSRFGCDLQTSRRENIEPTRTAPAVSATAAQMVVGELPKWLLGGGDQALRGEEVAYAMFGHRLWRTTLPYNPRCRCPHACWNVIDVEQHPRDVSLAELVGRMGGAPCGESNGFLVKSELPWINVAQCALCKRTQGVRRFDRVGRVLGACGCGGELVAQRSGLTSIPLEEWSACVCLPLSELGIDRSSALGIGSDDGWTYFFFQPTQTSREPTRP